MKGDNERLYTIISKIPPPAGLVLGTSRSEVVSGHPDAF